MLAPQFSEIADMARDESFWEACRLLVAEGNKVMPEVERASRITGLETRYKSLGAKVEARSEFGRLGFKLASTTNPAIGLATSGAKQLIPPIEDGITACIAKVRKIIVNDYDKGSEPDYPAVNVRIESEDKVLRGTTKNLVTAHLSHLD
ncbi:hypothetical protein FRB95_000109 [Tulasnella sp. JGI-2019a]|nr:hypothetical protein FRB95_000109 [Tulasnella sp. JGI-2019a]